MKLEPNMKPSDYPYAEQYSKSGDCSRSRAAAGSQPTVKVSADWLTLIKEMVFDAAIDMRQTRRTNQYNLTGQDIAIPEDNGDPPNPPLLIHQRGLDDSETREESLREAVRLIREKIDSANVEVEHE